MRALIALAVLLPFLAACGAPEEGTVIEMRHEDERYYEEWDMCKDRYPVTKTRYVPGYGDQPGRHETYTDWECRGGYVTRFDDEDWMIHLEKCEGGEETKGVERSRGNKERKCERGWREVDSAVFKRLKVGDYYTKDGANASGS